MAGRRRPILFLVPLGIVAVVVVGLELGALWKAAELSRAAPREAPPSPMSRVERELYAIVVEDQRKTAAPPRTVGDWPTEVRGSTYQSSDAENLFVALEILLSLERVERRRQLPGVEELRSRSDTLIERYLDDARRAGDPEGAVAFFPLQQHGPSQRRTHSSRFTFGDVPPDLDDTSQLALYLLGRSPEHPLIDRAVVLAGQWVDRDRPVQSREEEAWKQPGSGAFLTWVENRPAEASRVPMGRPNDVDCVVGLNVLGMLTRWERVRGRPLPEATARAKADTCALLRRVVRERLYPACSLYYGRPALFFWAAGRAIGEGLDCLDAERAALHAQLLELARTVPTGADHDHDAAALLLALELVLPEEACAPADCEAAEPLRRALRSRLRARPLVPAPLFEGQGGALGRADHLYYSSRAATAALALEALSVR